MVTSARVLSGAVVLVVAACVVLHSVTDDPTIADLWYQAVLVGAAVGAWIGAERLPRGRRLVPRLIAAGISLTALGDAAWSVLEAMGRDTDVSVADVPWFASYVVLCAALWVVLGRSHGPSEDRGAARMDPAFLIDVVTILVVSVLVFWSLSIQTIIAEQDVSPLVRATWASYPIADAVLLALVVRVLMSGRARATIDVSFGIGVCLWLAADIAYLHVPDDHTAQLLMDAAWMVAPVLLARAAWRTGAAETDPGEAPALGGWKSQLAVAVAPLLVPPGLELIADVRGQPDQPVQLLAGTAVLMALALIRTGRLIRSEESSRRELEHARDAALEASRAKSMFLTNMSHELRTPLTTVLASGEILEETQLDELQGELLAKMHRSGELLKTLVEGILDFSRIEAGQLEIVSREFALHAMVDDAAEVYVSRAQDSGLDFEWHLDPRLPQVVVGDAGRLFQVLTNLLDNALKFTHEGSVALAVRPVDEAGPDRGTVEFSVTDTGIGIGAEDQHSVFESFTQVDGSITRRYGGCGLGLAICRELTQLMGGSLAVHSDLGTGSVFVLRVPLPGVVEPPSVTRQPVASLG